MPPEEEQTPASGDGEEGASPEGEGAPEAQEGTEEQQQEDPLAQYDDDTLAKLASDPRIQQRVWQTEEGQAGLDKLIDSLTTERVESKLAEREQAQQAEQQAQSFEKMLAEAEERGPSVLERQIIDRYKTEKTLAPIRQEIEESVRGNLQGMFYGALDDIVNTYREATGIDVQATPMEIKQLQRISDPQQQVQAALKLIKSKVAKVKNGSQQGAEKAARRANVASNVARKAPPQIPGGSQEAPQESDLRGYLSEMLPSNRK